MMRNRLFRAVFGCLALAASACASSAAEDGLDDDMMSGEPIDEEELDAGDSDGTGQMGSDAGPRRDAGRTGDASTPGAPDAGGFDAGGGDGRDGSVPPKDASAPPPDASKPPVVDAGGPLMCMSGTTNCSNQCVDTRTSNAHCGACGKACAGGQTCTNSVCVAPVNVPNGCTAQSFQNRNYLYCTTNRTWAEARSSCLGAGMDLAIVSDAAESDFVKANGDSWVATNDRDREGSYVQVVPGNAQQNSGAAATYTRWSNSEPSNTKTCDGINIYVGCLGQQADEDCVMVRSDGNWNDDLCERNKRYVCEAY